MSRTRRTVFEVENKSDHVSTQLQRITEDRDAHVTLLSDLEIKMCNQEDLHTNFEQSSQQLQDDLESRKDIEATLGREEDALSQLDKTKQEKGDVNSRAGWLKNLLKTSYKCFSELNDKVVTLEDRIAQAVSEEEDLDMQLCTSTGRSKPLRATRTLLQHGTMNCSYYCRPLACAHL